MINHSHRQMSLGLMPQTRQTPQPAKRKDCPGL